MTILSSLSILCVTLLIYLLCVQLPYIDAAQSTFIPETQITAYERVRGTPYNVSYDHRAILINGVRTLFQSGSVHYPRMTPEMWPIVMKQARIHGINIIEAYVFWNVHEEIKGILDFSTGYRNISGFLTAAANEGLFVNLRIGPYICAEWNFGGLPSWLKFESGIEFRTMNTPWLNYSQSFVKSVVKEVEPYLARNGGPIVMAQIENEYSNIEGDKPAGKQYVAEQAAFALSLNLSIPWIMCSQQDAPQEIINTCNGYYCDGFIPNHQQNNPTQPHFWTEDWNGGPQYWGDPQQHRPVLDINFAVARFFEKGGSYHNYYMVFGGTNFDRRAGGPNIVVSYDYDAAINEFGLPNPAKFNIGRTMHYWLQYYSSAILGVDTIPPTVGLGNLVEANDYGALVFIANINGQYVNTTWPINSTNSYSIAPWSVSFLDSASGEIKFNTATGPFIGDVKPIEGIVTRRELPVAGPGDLSYSCYADYYGIWDKTRTKYSSSRPFEQISVTYDLTDYLFYFTTVTLNDTNIGLGYVDIDIKFPGDYLSVGVSQNGQLTSLSILDHGVGSATSLNISIPNSFNASSATLLILSQTIGLQHIGPNMEQWSRGFQSDSTIVFNAIDITNNSWGHLPGLQGELLEIQNWSSDDPGWKSTSTCRSKYFNSSLIWYRAQIQVPLNSDPEGVFAVDMNSMSKGVVWVNGHGLGRYWLKLASGSPGQGDCAPCNYIGSYQYNKCSTNCGEPSQRYWHVPRSFLVDGINEITFLEENPLTNGDAPALVNIVRAN